MSELKARLYNFHQESVAELPSPRKEGEVTPQIIKQFNETIGSLEQMMLLFESESENIETQLPLSKEFLKLESLNISNLFRDLVATVPENPNIAIVPNSLLNQASIYQMMLSIAFFNNRFIKSHLIAADKWITKDLEAQNLNDELPELPLKNVNEFNYHLQESVNAQNFNFNGEAIKLQLQEIIRYFKYLKRAIDPNNPSEYFSDPENKNSFKKCLDLLQLVVKLIKASWEEYKTLCTEEGTKPNSKIKLIVNTSVKNYLNRYSTYDFRKLAGLDISQEDLLKYEKELQPELRVLTSEELLDPIKVATVKREIHKRKIAEAKNSISTEENVQFSGYIAEMFNYNDKQFHEDVYALLQRRLRLFSPKQKINLSAFYGRIEAVAEELYIAGNEYTSAQRIDINMPKIGYDAEMRKRFIQSHEIKLKKLINRAITLNQMAIERYGIVEDKEIIYTMSVDYIKQIISHLRKNPKQLNLQENNPNDGYGFCIEFNETNNDAAEEITDNFLYVTQTFPSNYPNPSLNLNLLNPVAITIPKFMIAYVNEAKEIEVNISIGGGYQSFACSCDEGPDNYETAEQLSSHFTPEGLEKLLLERQKNQEEFDKLSAEEQEIVISKQFDEMMRGVLVIARELEIPLKLK